MAMMDDNRYMVDTNVLIYGTASSSPWHQEARGRLAVMVDKGKAVHDANTVASMLTHGMA